MAVVVVLTEGEEESRSGQTREGEHRMNGEWQDGAVSAAVCLRYSDKLTMCCTGQRMVTTDR